MHHLYRLPSWTSFMLAVGPLLLIGLALVGPGIAPRSLGMAAAGTGYDPLTTGEEELLIRAALTTDQTRAAGEQEVLLVERHEEGKATYRQGQWARRGDVYLYDYSTNTLHVSIIDVATGEVEKTESVQGVQLPLTAAEVTRALAVVDGDAALRATLAVRYRQATGEELRSLDQLQVKVSVFRADAMPDRVEGAARLCGLRRCAQLLFFTVDDVAFEMLPVVDLGQQTVLGVITPETP